MRSAAVTGIVVCIGSWLALWALAGWIGLSRSVAVGPFTLFERPLAIVAPTAIAFAGAYAAGTLMRPASPLAVLAAVLVGDLVGAAVLAPIAVGELEVIHTPIVFPVLALLGLQPVAAVTAAWLAARRIARE